MGDAAGMAAGAVGAVRVWDETGGVGVVVVVVVVGISVIIIIVAEALGLVIVLVPEHVALVALEHERVDLRVERRHGGVGFSPVWEGGFGVV